MVDLPFSLHTRVEMCPPHPRLYAEGSVMLRLVAGEGEDGETEGCGCCLLWQH